MALIAKQPVIDLYIEGGERWIRVAVNSANAADYPTGGYAVPASLFNFISGFMRQKLGGPATATGVGSGVDAVVQPIVIEYTPVTAAIAFVRINLVTGNLQYFASTFLEVAANTNVSSVTVLLEAFGH